MKQSVFSLLAAFFVGSFLLFQSCKEDTILNADVLPGNDTVNTVIVPDTMTILSKSVLDDSIITSLNISGVPVFHAIGALASDPYSGKTNASIYFQVVPPTLGFSFPKAPDSAVLILPYAGLTWGDTTAANITQTFNVYEVSDSLSKDSSYYSFTTKAVNRSKIIGTAQVSFKSVKDSFTVAGAKRPPHLRIRLDTAFVSKLRNEATNNSESYTTYAGFLRFLKGLYVEAADSNVGNSLYYFSLEGGSEYSRANISFYYTDKTSTNEDTVKTASFFYSSTYGAHYNRITRNYAGTPTGSLFASTAVSDSVIVIQNEPGAALDLKFPFIKNLPKQPINKAELIITQLVLPGDQSDKYWPMGRLYPTGINPDGSSYTLLDRFPTTSAVPLLFMDGSRRTVVIGGSTVYQYIINIPREVQKAIVEQKDMLHLRINGAVTYPGAYRFIGAGRNYSNSQYRVKLNIVYSKT